MSTTFSPAAAPYVTDFTTSAMKNATAEIMCSKTSRQSQAALHHTFVYCGRGNTSPSSTEIIYIIICVYIYIYIYIIVIIVIYTFWIVTFCS